MGNLVKDEQNTQMISDDTKQRELIEALQQAADYEDDELIEMPIELNATGLIGEDGMPLIGYDIEAFKKGVKAASVIAGMYSALRTVGASEDFIALAVKAEFETHDLKAQFDTQLKLKEMDADNYSANEL